MQSNLLNFTLAICSFLLFSSCTKEGIETTDSSIGPKDYFPLKEGNYWIYDIYAQKGSLAFEKTQYSDSTYIGKDTIISGKKYHSIHTTYGEYVGSPPNIPKTYYLRDSSEFLLAPLGYKWFSTKMEDFKIHEKLVLDQQGIKINHSITMKNAPDIDVNGTLFPCLHADHLYTMSRLLSKVNSEINYYNYGSTWYARGVGPVKKVLIGYTNNSPNSPREEKRLVRYFVKK